jgi:segregation and condensation protein B
MSYSVEQLKKIIEAALLSAGKPLSINKLLSLFEEDKQPGRDEIREAISALTEECQSRGVEVKEVASGYRIQAKQEFSEWISKLWEERPPKYSRALLETLVLVAYRQPITRGEIEHVRGVSVSTNIMRTLLERDWVKVVGHRDVPGRPAIYSTTKAFLDYFNLKSLQELPTLAEIRDLDKINAELEFGIVDPDMNQDESEGDDDTGDSTTADVSPSDNSATSEDITEIDDDINDSSSAVDASLVDSQTVANNDEEAAVDEDETNEVHAGSSASE